MLRKRFAAAVLLFGTLTLVAQDPGERLKEEIASQTGGKLVLTFELRSRIEDRTGEAFGLNPDIFANFVRTRVGLSYKPVSWIRFAGLGQDARAPLLDRPAPGSMRDPFDLQEGYFEIRPDAKTGLGAIAGRQMLYYGDSRLIGAPQWAYTARTYDNARIYWRLPKGRLEALFISPIKPNGSGWNRPILGDRVWGTYNTLEITPAMSLEPYVLRHDQNRPGGYNGVGRLETNSFGFRAFGPFSEKTRYEVDLIYQNGQIGLLPHRAYAWVTQLGHKSTLAGKKLDTAAEYKYASGSDRTDRSGTFDQLFPAAHDKLGHADVLGWRNVRNVKAWTTLSLNKAFSLTAMYNNTWLASARDAAYNAQGAPIARSPSGLAGTHIGQEADLFLGYKRYGFSFAAGIGQFFAGEFVRNATPGLSPRLLYVSQSYGF